MLKSIKSVAKKPRLVSKNAQLLKNEDVAKLISFAKIKTTVSGSIFIY